VVFAGATAALWCVAAIAVLIGHRAGKLLDPRWTKRIAAVLFAAIGGALLAGLL
jgi:putative Ca2+/H+ antiporter (TMEM165/GDT1 family)